MTSVTVEWVYRVSYWCPFSKGNQQAWFSLPPPSQKKGTQLVTSYHFTNYLPPHGGFQSFCTLSRDENFLRNFCIKCHMKKDINYKSFTFHAGHFLITQAIKKTLQQTNQTNSGKLKSARLTLCVSVGSTCHFTDCIESIKPSGFVLWKSGFLHPGW